MKGDETLQVVAHFSAAEHPFKDDSAERTETIGRFKARLLAAFGLAEGQGADGNVVYTLYHNKTPLENLEQMLGEIAGDQKVLQLKLSQQIIQGNLCAMNCQN